MATVKQGYLTRKTAGSHGAEPVYRNWWLVKYGSNRKALGRVGIDSISFPEEYIGKKVRFKVEVLEE